jgi:hypothetical protein
LQSAKFLNRNKNTYEKEQIQSASNAFEVTKLDDNQKINDKFMEDSIAFSNENILNAMREMHTNIFANPQFNRLKKQLIGAAIALQTMSLANPAYAADMPEGMISFTQFMKGVNSDVIERVRVAGDGRTAQFLNVDGGRGAVNLLNDPNLFKILQEHKIDLTILPPDTGNQALFGILGSIAFPLTFILGLFLVN